MSLLTLGDKILIIILLITNISLIFFITGTKKNGKVFVEVDQKLVGMYPLNQPQKISITGVKGGSEIEIREGKVKMIDSCCPNKYCLKTGWIDSQGQIICCVPNKVLIRISGNNNNNSNNNPVYDAVSR